MAPTGDAVRVLRRGEMWRVDPVPRQIEQGVGILAERRVLPPPLQVALAFRNLLAGGVEVSDEALREPDVRNELQGPGR